MTLSLILFALGVGLISLLFNLNKQIQAKFDKNLADIDLVIGAKGSPLQMILCSMYHIDAPTGNITTSEARPFLRSDHPLIKRAIPLSLGDSHHGYRIVGTNTGILELYNAEIGVGQLWKEDFEVTIGSGVAHDLNLKTGDSFYSSHGFIMDDHLVHSDGEAFKVSGILQPTGSVVDQLILTNTQSIWKVHEHEEEEEEEEAHEEDHESEEHSHEEVQNIVDATDKQITSLLVQFKHRNFQTLNMQRAINENTDMQAASPAIEINRLHSMMGVGMDALQLLALIIILVSGISVFISLYASLKERKYELALMRVMGSSPQRLFLLITLEGLILAGMGYALGITLSHLSLEIFAGYLKDSYRYSFTGLDFLKEEVWLFAGSLAIGFLAALLPALSARNTDISDTLANG